MSEDTLKQIEGQESTGGPNTPHMPRQKAKRHSKLLQEANTLLDDAYWRLQDLLEAKQEAFGERSESWQESEKGQAAQVELDWLEQASCHVEEAQGSLAELAGN